VHAGGLKYAILARVRRTLPKLLGQIKTGI
jgi:hypothetical protein